MPAGRTMLHSEGGQAMLAGVWGHDPHPASGTGHGEPLDQTAPQRRRDQDARRRLPQGRA